MSAWRPCDPPPKRWNVSPPAEIHDPRRGSGVEVVCLTPKRRHVRVRRRIGRLWYAPCESRQLEMFAPEGQP